MASSSRTASCGRSLGLAKGAFHLDGHGALRGVALDSFLDASLLFARDATYLLSLLMVPSPPRFAPVPRKRSRLLLSAGSIERLLPERRFLVGEGLTLADICFVAELALFSNERARKERLSGRPPVGSRPAGGMTPHTRWPSRISIVYDGTRISPDVEPYLEKIDRAAS